MNSDYLKVLKTKKVYGLLWGKTDTRTLPESYHFDKMQAAIQDRIVRGQWGIGRGL